MTHRTSADYYAGIPQYGQQQLVAQNHRLRAAVDRCLLAWDDFEREDGEALITIGAILRTMQKEWI